MKASCHALCQASGRRQALQLLSSLWQSSHSCRRLATVVGVLVGLTICLRVLSSFARSRPLALPRQLLSEPPGSATRNRDTAASAQEKPLIEEIAWSVDELAPHRGTILWMIKLYPPLHNAGAECMAHTMNQALLRRGWTVVVALPGSVRGVYEGVRLMDVNDAAALNEVLVREPLVMMQLNALGSRAHHAALEHDLHVVEVVHNTWELSNSNEKESLGPQRLHFVYNSEWVKRAHEEESRARRSRSVVVRPLVDWRQYAVESTREFVTLVNTCENKGGGMLIKLARAMPHVQFLGVRGAYGDSVENHTLPNLRYLNNTPRVAQEVYARTSILLAPSQYESWGRAAVEALASGIPVIASPTPGLQESLADAAIFVDTTNAVGWVGAISRLREGPEYYWKVSERARQRAAELDPRQDLEQLHQLLRWVASRG